MSRETFEKVKSFVCDQRGKYRKPLTRQTTLEDDLGITGLDGADFMDAFFEKFDITPPETFEWQNYFGPECFDPFGLGPIIYCLIHRIRFKKWPTFIKPVDITLEDLERSIDECIWYDPYRFKRNDIKFIPRNIGNNIIYDKFLKDGFPRTRE